MRRFNASVSLTKNQTSGRHQVEITVVWKTRRSTLTIEVQRAMSTSLVASCRQHTHCCCVLSPGLSVVLLGRAELVAVPVSGLNITSHARFIAQSGHAHTVRHLHTYSANLQSAANILDLSEADDSRPGQTLVNLASFIVKEGGDIGAVGRDDGTAAGLVSTLFRFAKNGDISFQTARWRRAPASRRPCTT